MKSILKRDSHSEGSDLIGSNTAEAEEDTDPSNEAEDWSCWVTVAGVYVIGVSGVLLVTSKNKKGVKSECVAEWGSK